MNALLADPETFSKLNIAALRGRDPSISWVQHSTDGRVGASIHILDQTSDPYFKSALVYFAPNSSTSPHLHEGYEYIHVLDGAFEDEFGNHCAGELLMYRGGSIHRWKSVVGALLYVIWTGPTPTQPDH